MGTVPVITLFLLIFFQGIKIAKNCNDPFGVFLSVGIVSNFILYAFVCFDGKRIRCIEENLCRCRERVRKGRGRVET